MERLTNVNVAQPCDDLLVRERRLERGFLSFAKTRERAGIELMRKRLGPEVFQQRLMLQIRARHKLHHAKAAWIVEQNQRPGRHEKAHMIMHGMLRARMVIASN